MLTGVKRRAPGSREPRRRVRGRRSRVSSGCRSRQATASYKDSQGKQTFSMPDVRDWSTYKGRQWMTNYCAPVRYSQAVRYEADEDLVCGLGPDVGLGIVVPGRDTGADVGLEGAAAVQRSEELTDLALREHYAIHMDGIPAMLTPPGSPSSRAPAPSHGGFELPGHAETLPTRVRGDADVDPCAPGHGRALRPRVLAAGDDGRR